MDRQTLTSSSNFGERASAKTLAQMTNPFRATPS